MTSATLLREAIAAVKAGQRQYAQELLLELVELDPTNELAWVWLSGLLESREEQILALENSIAVSKGGPGLEGRLQRLGKAKSGPELEHYKAAMSALDKGDRKRGKLLLEKVVATNRDHERAWTTLADLAANEEEEAIALESVVRINPNNFKARERLTKIQHLLYQRHLNHGRMLEQQGDLMLAIEAYRSAERFASTGSFREAARQRRQIAEANREKASAKGPSLRMLFSATVPPLLYLILFFAWAGTRLGEVSQLYLACAGGVAVVAGTALLVIGGTSRPRSRDLDRPMVGGRGLRWARPVGWLLLLLPFLFLLMGIASRMNVVSWEF